MAGLFLDWLVKSRQIAFGGLAAPVAHRLLFCSGDWAWDATLATVVASEVDVNVRGVFDPGAVLAALDPTTKKAVQPLTVAVEPSSDLEYDGLAWVGLDGADAPAYLIAGYRFATAQILPAGQTTDFDLRLASFNVFDQPYGGAW